MENIYLENEYVLLRPVELEDIEGILEGAIDERIWEHMSVQLLSRESVEEYVHKAIAAYKDGSNYLFVIIEKVNNNIVGCTSFLDISLPQKRLEIGATWLNPVVWASHVNTNCKYLLLSYCFEELACNRVQIKTGHENIRSQRAIERIGAKKEGILRNHMIRREGQIRHTVMYSIVKDEWPMIKERFEKQLL